MSPHQRGSRRPLFVRDRQCDEGTRRSEKEEDVMNRRNVIATLGVLIALNSWALPAKAQAWVPAQGDGSVSLIVSDIYSKYPYLPVDPIDLGHLRSYTGVLDLTYGLTDRM